MEKEMDTAVKIEIDKKFYQIERTRSVANNVSCKPEAVISALEVMLREGMPTDSTISFYDDISNHKLIRIVGYHQVEEEIPSPQLELLPEVS
tara:strand:+ start:1516 stop:1791 length:276 start_codon:yes stop_codon:yes gene_type:complete